MKREHWNWEWEWCLAVLAVAAAVLPVGSACNGGAGTGTLDTNDENVLINDALDYDGSVSGKVFDSQSTRESFDAGAAEQAVPPQFDTANTSVHFKDLDGNDLRDPSGQTIDGVSLHSDGSFSADGLPVGTDFTVCVDIHSDGDCDLERSVNIPQEEGGEGASLSDVRVDPLTMMVLAKLRTMIEERGVDVADLPISPAAVVTRIVEAYRNLFEESGIDHVVTLEDIEALSLDQLAELFDSALPPAVQTGMQIVDGNLKAVTAADAEALALAVAEVFVRAGFPILDLPGPPDFSGLAQLEGIIEVPKKELFGDDPQLGDPGGIPEELLDQFADEFPDGLPDDLSALLDDLADQFPEGILSEFADDGIINPAEVDDFLGPIGDEHVYVSTLAEPDRNFANAEGESGDEGGSPMPMLNDFILMEMARLHLEHRRISLGDLHELVTSLDDGLGARLTYFINDPNFFGPPLNVFETSDGNGKAINTERLNFQFFEQGFHELDHETFEQREQELRNMMRELLGDTVPPAFDRLFNAIVRERIEGVEALAHALRSARAHLPFNRSGASAFFVVADGDIFRQRESSDGEAGAAEVREITVDAEVSLDGEILSVVYSPTHNGRFLLGFTERTEEDGKVELIVRETGRFMHGRQGPVRASIHNENIFQPVNGMPFAQFVSEAGIFYPGTHVTVVRDEFAPEAPDGDMSGPHEQLFVLATGIGEGAQPVRVDYDDVTGMATYNPGGRHLLMFLPDSSETGMFALFNEDTGRPASLFDPEDFFMAPHEQPEGFEDFYNEVDDFADFGDFETVDQFVDDFFPPPPDGENPPPPDGDPPPPPDGDPPPPPDGELPPPPPDELIVPAQLEGEDGSVDLVEDPLGIGEEPLPPVDAEPVIDGGEPIDDGPMGDPGFILIKAEEVQGLFLERESFTRVFGTEVPNPRYNPDDDPYYDDLNANGAHDPGEVTAPFRPMLFDPHDWRSTDIRNYYRRADNGGSAGFEDVDWESATPKPLDGTELVPRTYRTRLNACRFGRPNTAINLLTAFAPPEFFDGTHALDRTTPVDVFMAIALINLVMDQVFNVEAEIDLDGLGPLPRERVLIDAHLFVPPLGDPFQLLLDGFRRRSVVPSP